MDRETIEQNKPVRIRSNDIKPKRKPFFKRVFAKIFLPVTGILNGVEADYPESSRIRKTFVAMLKLRGWICIPLAVLICAGGCFFAYKSSNTATAEMSLNYEEAANGLNPNSTRFNAYNISSKEVVEDMLRYAGIDPKTVDVNNLCDSITISSTNNKAFSEDDYYISTTFKITLKKPVSIKGISTEDLLEFLCKAYKDNLYSNYTENRSILDFDIDVFNDKEYLEIADLLDMKAQQIEKYLNTRAKQSKSFVETESDETFKSLVQKVEDIREYDVAKYRTFVIETGCSDNKSRYISSLSYVNQLKSIDYQKDMTAYNVHNEGIRMYDDAMISVVMIPSIDEGNNTYYMSKTKTGMDYIANKASQLLTSAQGIAKEMTTNQEIMAKMGSGTNDAANIQKANRMIKEIRDKYTELSRQIEAVDKAYVKYKTKDYLTFKTVQPSIIQRIRLDLLMELAAGYILLIYAFIWLRFRYFAGGVEK